MAEFQVFTKRGSRRRSSIPLITLQTKGLLSINPQAHELLGMPEAVVLLYDQEERGIGIRASDPSSPYAYRLRTTKGGTSRIISAGAYFKHFDITFTKRIALAASLMDDILAAYLPRD